MRVWSVPHAQPHPFTEQGGGAVSAQLWICARIVTIATSTTSDIPL